MWNQCTTYGGFVHSRRESGRVSTGRGRGISCVAVGSFIRCSSAGRSSGRSSTRRASPSRDRGINLVGCRVVRDQILREDAPGVIGSVVAGVTRASLISDISRLECTRSEGQLRVTADRSDCLKPGPTRREANLRHSLCLASSSVIALLVAAAPSDAGS